MAQNTHTPERRTNVDEIFDSLYSDIVTLKIMPGTKISEIEIAKQFDVSRQPVRDAFARLGNIGLLIVRPQKATEVRKFSVPEILHARFVRTAMEVEVLRLAVQTWPTADTSAVRRNIEQQGNAVVRNDQESFHNLDFEFHKLLCIASGSELVFDTIADAKTKLDRLCVLSLDGPTELAILFEDHKNIISALDENDAGAVEDAIREHLGRLGSVVTELQQEHSEYFE